MPQSDWQIYRCIIIESSKLYIWHEQVKENLTRKEYPTIFVCNIKPLSKYMFFSKKTVCIFLWGSKSNLSSVYKQFVWRCYFTFRNTDFLHLDLLLEELLVIFSDSEVEVNFRKRVPHLFTTSVHPLPVSALISFYWYFPSPLYLVDRKEQK